MKHEVESIQGVVGSSFACLALTNDDFLPQMANSGGGNLQSLSLFQRKKKLQTIQSEGSSVSLRGAMPIWSNNN